MSQDSVTDHRHAAPPRAVETFPERFRGAAGFYTSGRPAYPQRLARRVATLVGGLEQGRVLDLGTGPGFLAIDFAPLAGAVIGVDPEPAMLAAAERNAAAAAAGRRIRFLPGTGETLDPGLAPLRLVTIGRAFHWMDRPRTLAVLDRLVAPRGAVALFGTAYPDVPENAWVPAFQAVLDRYDDADPARTHLRTARNHDAELLASTFGHLERVAVLERRRTPLARLVDRAFSFGKVWGDQPDRLPPTLAEEVRAALAPHAVEGSITEVVEGRATIAWRPGEID
ncbi:Class I SAM-dependent methyltransferase [Rhodovastum atsumiense]|nr:class I SAM-dependent methyltransferase [Rhodovastum atsumiense]CAH2602735.1 Class I SAM-dependent methyltransferase [Rhodovastum atsumiense]